MIEAYKNFWSHYFDFKSQSSRSDFWWVYLINMIIDVIGIFSLGLAFAIMMIAADTKRPDFASIMIIGAILLVYGAYKIATIIPFIALSVRRIRDTGLSPWWYLLVIPSGFTSSMTFSTAFTRSQDLIGYTSASSLISLACSIALLVMYVAPTDIWKKQP